MGFIKNENERYSLPAPPYSEQKEIVKYDKNKSVEIEAAIESLNQQIQKLQEYKATLINSAVTGKIKISE